MIHFARLPVASVAAVLLLSSAVSACDYGYCWGAVGLGPNGVSGYSRHQATVPAAEAELRRACGDKCNIIEIFNDTCAALVQGDGTVTFLGLEPTRAAANQEATDLCQAQTDYCVVRVEICSLKK